MKKKIQISLLLSSLLIVAYTGYEMKRLSDEESLWGHFSLFFLLGSWGLIVSIISLLKRHFNHRYFLLSCISGLLLSIGFPGLLPVPLFMFMGFVPLLMVEHFITGDGGQKSGRQFFWYAFNTFILYNILTTWWVANAALAPGIFANVVNSLLATIPLVLYHKISNKIPRLAGMAFVALFITYEYNHFYWDLSWPWLALGNGFAEVPSWIQWYEYTGIFGGSLWILVINFLIFRLWVTYSATAKWNKKQLSIILSILVVPIIISMVMYSQITDKGTKVEVAVVQPNYEPHYEKFKIPENIQAKHYLKLAASVVDENTDFLVLPETSFGYVEDRRMDSYPAIQQLYGLLAKYPKLKIVVGLSAYHLFREGEPRVGAVREQKMANGKSRYLETYNYAVQLPLDNPPQAHKKSKLVPGAEIFPFKKILFVFKPLVDALGGTLEGNGTESTPAVLKSEKANIAPLICYESVYGDYVANFVRHGASLLFVMTNDGWWDDTPGHRQHLYFASLRSIETRKSIARAANSGISAFINQRGDILSQTKYNEAKAIKHTLYANSEKTFYVKWGDLIARISLFLSIVLVLNLIVRAVVPADYFTEANAK